MYVALQMQIINHGLVNIFINLAFITYIRKYSFRALQISLHCYLPSDFIKICQHINYGKKNLQASA